MKYQRNDDGSLVLDTEGNPIIELTDEEKESAREKGDLVNEIKELRLKNGVMKDLLDNKEEEPETPPEVPPEDEKIVSVVKKLLDSEKASNAQANKKAAFEKFVTDNKEFHPENDTLGLKLKALESKFRMFNTEGLTTVEEFYTVIGDAKRLLVGNDTQQDTSKGKIPNSDIPPRSNPGGKKEEELTEKELKLAEQTGRTKEDILKMKLKHPQMLADILEYVRD